MSKTESNKEAELISWMAQQGPFVKAHARFPFVWRTMRWLAFAALTLLPALIFAAIFWSDDNPFRQNLVVIALIAWTAVRTVLHVRYLRFKRLVTGLAAADTATFAKAELRHLGYGVMWTTEPGVGILRLEASTGFGKERHILMIVADDNRLLIHAVDAHRPFFMLNNPRPFKRLVARLRQATGRVTPLASVASLAA